MTSTNSTIAIKAAAASDTMPALNTWNYQTFVRDVKSAEQANLQWYFNGAADGNFGTGTQTAVKKFQEDNQLDADGIAGKMTQEALFAKSSVTPIPDATVGPDDIMDLPG